MIRMALYLTALLIVISSATASSADGVPDSRLRVTVQQKVDGKIINGFHVLELSCLDGKCSLSSVSLNQCSESAFGKQAFYPAFQYASTAIGNLKAKNQGNTIVVQETGSDMIGDYVKNMRFEYAPAGEDRIVTRLTGFSGGYVKNAPGLKKVFALDYVPLPKTSQIMKLDCDALLPGIDKK